MFLKFLTGMSWVFLVLSILVIGLRCHGAWTYTERDQALDYIRGVRRSFDVTAWVLILIVCIVWLVTYYI